jgi:hypothetical protein
MMHLSDQLSAALRFDEAHVEMDQKFERVLNGVPMLWTRRFKTGG